MSFFNEGVTKKNGRLSVFPPSTFYFLLSTLLLVALLSSCSETDNEKQIDEAYLESGEYQSFAEDARVESERRRDTGVQNRLMRLPECRDVRSLSLPLTIDEEELESFMDEGRKCPALQSPIDTDTGIRLIGRLSGSDPESWLIILEPVSVYKKRELAVVTAVNGELSAFETIALYQENLSRQITTELLIEQNGEIHIRAVSHRKISYPIEQESTGEVRFVIRTDGTVEKRDYH